MRGRAWNIAAIGLALVGLLAGEATGATESPKVKVGIFKISSFTPIHVAAVKGYYREEGLADLEFVTGGGSAELFQILQAGRVQISTGSTVSAILAKAGGFNLTVLTLNETAKPEPPDSGALFVRSDSGIRSLKDLEGKRVSVNALNDVTYLTTMVAMKKRGVDGRKVRWTEVRLPHVADALLNGHVDAGFTAEPFTTVLMGTGKAAAIAYPYVETAPNFMIGVILARDDWAKANPRAAEAFVRATRRGIDHLNQAGDAEVRKMVVQFTGMKPEIANKMLLTVWSHKLNVADLQTLADYMLEFKLLTRSFDVKTLLHKLATTY